jgi:hypothetical protein
MFCVAVVCTHSLPGNVDVVCTAEKVPVDPPGGKVATATAVSARPERPNVGGCVITRRNTPAKKPA